MLSSALQVGKSGNRYVKVGALAQPSKARRAAEEKDELETMSSTQLELLRQNHELIERCELAIGEELDRKPSGQKPKVWQQHRLKGLIDNIASRSKELKRLYEDGDDTLKEELKVARTSGITAFYEAVNNAKEYYTTFPNATAGSSDDTFVQIDVNFSGEEVFGKYLDLNALHLQFSNVIRKANIEQDYLQYLERFNKFFYLPDAVRNSRHYAEYLDSLWAYLADFFRRTNPLPDWAKIEEDIRASFSSAGNGAAASGSAARTSAAAPQALRLGMFNAVEELEALGMDRLKEALEALGLKCGGTLRDRAARLWSVRGKKPEDFPAGLRAKDSADTKRRKADAASSSSEEPTSVAWKEHRVQALCDIMSGVVNATVRHAEKQQTRTAEEREAELREEEFGLPQDAAGAGAAGKKRAGEEDEDDDAPVYNPLNLPLGWDGKPIPYWMYKLHGLGVEYKCQICGDASYWGRRAFDRHFQEWKHAHGMRSLGIPNTKHFHDITLIDDAVALYGKIKAEIQVGQFQGDMEEEFEDTHGNILNRRTYEDLARQGLL